MGPTLNPPTLTPTLARRSILLRASTYETGPRYTRCTGAQTPRCEACTRAAASWSASPTPTRPSNTTHPCTTPTPTHQRQHPDAHPHPHAPQHAPHQVNYVYELATIDANHSAYVTSGTVAASPAVRALVALAE